LSTNKLHTC